MIDPAHQADPRRPTLRLGGVRPAAWLRAWRLEEALLQGRSRAVRPLLLATLALPLVLAIDALLRWDALQRDHERRLRESVAILTATLGGLERTTVDWGHWSALYDWLHGRNPSFPKTDLETTPLFDGGGVFLLFAPTGEPRLSFSRRGYGHPSTAALFACARPHLQRLPNVISRIQLICRDGEGVLHVGVATPVTNSSEDAPAFGTLVMFEPLLRPAYGPAFNEPLRWLSAHMRSTPLGEGPLTAAATDGTASPSGSETAARAESPGTAATPARREEQLVELSLKDSLYTAGGREIVLSRDPLLPPLLRGLGRDLLLLLLLLAGALGVRMLLLLDRRRQRLQLRRSEQLSNRRIRRAGEDLDRLLERVGMASRQRGAEERVLARLIEAPLAGPAERSRGATMERKLEELADRFQHFLDRARDLALLDPLTQLPNRRYFIEQVQLQVENSRHSGERFAILFVDVDKFKNINDSYGHAIGDAALVTVADKLRQLTRRDDFLGRYGGDEFAILMDLTQVSDDQDPALRQTLQNYARRIVEPFEQAVDLQGFLVELSISVGISVVDSGDSDVETAMRRSDIAMYRAKQNSNDRIAIFDISDDATQLDNYRLYGDLMQSIRDHDFQIFFQPIVDRSGRVLTLEALSRWKHPRLGLLSPDVFLDLAERYRQMNPLSDELIALSFAAFKQASQGHDELRLSLNLPPSKLSDPELPQQLSAGLRNCGLEPHRLTIELTERSILVPNAIINTNLRQLRALGMAIALDDFGTGYSSLSLLNTLQPEEVKIDKSFVLAMGSDRYARQIVSLIADMAQRMGLAVVAEGVEDGEALERLVALGIRQFQGYHFARPLPLEALRSSGLLERGAAGENGSS